MHISINKFISNYCQKNVFAYYKQLCVFFTSIDLPHYSVKVLKYSYKKMKCMRYFVFHVKMYQNKVQNIS